jgi:hypothetical protein
MANIAACGEGRDAGDKLARTTKGWTMGEATSGEP